MSEAGSSFILDPVGGVQRTSVLCGSATRAPSRSSYVIVGPENGKSSSSFVYSSPNGQAPVFVQDSEDLRSRARVTVPGFRTALRVAARISG
jgi:hypothetical protein